MRRDASVLVAALLSLSLLGCAGSQQADTDSARQSSSVPEIEVRDQAAGTSATAPAADPASFAGMLEAHKVASIRVIGDSQTAGYLLDGYDGESDTGVVVYEGSEGVFTETATSVPCWTNLFRAYAANHGVKDFVNAGVSGSRMQYLAEEPASWLGDGADVIVVMLGTNDACKVSVEEFRGYAEQALTACDEASKHLVVVTPPKNNRNDAQNLYGMEEIDQVLTELCKEHDWEHISLIDTLQPGTDDFFEDEAHPTETGSKKLWEAFRSQLKLPN